jgi:hypothetical protein
MYFVPLSQLESVELLVHSLRAAAGEADCTMCPAYKVCMKQCLVIANSVEQMMESGMIPEIGEKPEEKDSGKSEGPETDPPGGGSGGKGGLRVVK